MAILPAVYWSSLSGYQTSLPRVQDLHSFSCKMLPSASSEASVLLSTWESTERIPSSQLLAESFTKSSDGLSCELLELGGLFSSTSERKCRQTAYKRDTRMTTTFVLRSYLLYLTKTCLHRSLRNLESTLALFSVRGPPF